MTNQSDIAVGQSSRSKMRVEQKSAAASSALRFLTFAILLIVQIWFLVGIIMRYEQRYPWIATLISGLSMAVSFAIYNRNMNSAFKIPWMILITVFPILGLSLYFLMGNHSIPGRIKKQFLQIDEKLKSMCEQDEEVLIRLRQEDKRIANEFQYLLNTNKVAVYQNTDLTYYSDAADGLDAMIEDLKKAEKFIFMEYHAIEDKESFGRILDVLTEKVKEGVEVRVFYDDVGSGFFISTKFLTKLRERGIQCGIFNPVIPFINIFMNNRDHRKITVIDGKVAFTGGYNLANEYFHLTEPYGFWKDTGIRLEGDAVRSMTLLFMELWNSMQKEEQMDFSETYLPKYEYQAKDTGYVQPYGGNPLSKDHVAEEVYLNVLRGAKDYCYFVTPYLIITDEMTREMVGAAKRGVDVRIITPGIPDKKMVYRETRSFYGELVRGGVRIYEYTPGFSHAKMCVSDHELATVGTINLDYRSLYHHFENGILMYKTSVIEDIDQDFQEMFSVSKEVTEDYKRDHLRIDRTFLRLVSPLL